MFPTFLKKQKPNIHFYLDTYQKSKPLKLRKCYLNFFKTFNYTLFKQIEDVCFCIIFQRKNEFNSLCLNSRFWLRILFQMLVLQLIGQFQNPRIICISPSIKKKLLTRISFKSPAYILESGFSSLNCYLKCWCSLSFKRLTFQINIHRLKNLTWSL